MENIKDTIQTTIQNSVSNISSKGKLIVTQTLSLEKKDIIKKIFDNMVWVVVLVGVLVLGYFAYLLTESFNIDKTIQLMNKEYKITRPISVDVPSESGMEERFDEVKVDKHTLSDIFICSSAKSYLSGRQVFDYVSKQMFFQTVKLGARYCELDLFENNEGNIVVSNGLFEGNWRLTINEIYFEDFCKEIPTRVFNKEYTNNYNDPFILFLGLHITKNKMNLVAKIIEQYMKNYLAPDGYNMTNGGNILELNLEELLGKIIIITDGKIANTELLKYTNLRVGEKVRKLSYSELLLEDKERLKEFNKHHLTIVVPDPNISSLNYNPELVFDTGCQISSMNFQYVGDHMKAYLSKFYDKSIILKPYEFTKYSDIPQKGYDPKKIAYYNNYEILSNKDERGGPSPSGTKRNDYNVDKDSIFFKNKIGALTKEDTREGCCKLFVEDEDLEDIYPIDNVDTSITDMLHKISELEHKPDDLVLRIDQARTKEEIKDIADLFTYESPAPTDSINSQELKYDILKKQLTKILQDKREEIFKAGLKDPCFKEQDKHKCSANPLCYFDSFDSPGESDTKCESKLSSIPYPKLCLPKYIAPNRNMCLSSEKDKGFIDSKGVRQIFHEKMTQPGFSGKWNSYLGPITIDDNFNNQCEFKFTTKHDNKEFTMFMVDGKSGNYFNIDREGEDNFIGISNYYKLRAKGTFIDPMLRRVEKDNNFPEMPYHGYIEIKMDDYTDENKDPNILKQCLNSKFIGIYRYSEKVYSPTVDRNNIIKTYSDIIDNYYDNIYDNTGIVLGYDKPLVEDTKSPNIYCYKVLSNECLDENIITFDTKESEPPSHIYAPAEDEEITATELVKMTETIGLEFTEEEIENNPKLRKRLIGMIGSEKPELIEKRKQELEEEKEQEELAEKIIEEKRVQDAKKEIVKKADLFIYHTSVASSATQKKPADAFRINGPGGVPFCIQRKMADNDITNCADGLCDSSTAYIGPCGNSPNIKDPFCENIDASHNIQFESDGTSGDNRTQIIKFLNNGDEENPIDACLSYNDKGDVLYSNCRLNKNVDNTINNQWKVYRTKEQNKFKLTSPDGKCLTRSPYNNMNPKDLEDGLYKKEPILEQLFSSAKMIDCSDKEKDNQHFDIKFMGDIQNCASEAPNAIKKMEYKSTNTTPKGFLQTAADKEL